MRGIILTGLVAAVALTLNVSVGQAKAPPAFHGVSAAVAPAATDYQRMKAGGVDIARVQMYWGSVEPSPGVRSWVVTDSVVEGAARGGVELLPLFSASPPWLSGAPARPPIYSAEQRSAWMAFLRDFSARYGPGGTFWQLRPDVPQTPIQAIQIWNEPSLGFFWGGKPNAAHYASLIDISAAAIGAVQPEIKIVTGGIFPRSAAGNNISPEKFIRRLFRSAAFRRNVDAFGIHPYATSPRDVLREAFRLRRLVNRAGGKGLPLWATEFGWTTGGAGWRKSPFRATRRQQSKRLSLTYKLLERNAGRLRLERALWFSWRDFDEPGADSWTARSGLFGTDGTAKPAWFSYVRRAGGSP